MTRRLKLLGNPVHKMALRDKGRVLTLLRDLDLERKVGCELVRREDVYVVLNTTVDAATVVDGVQIRRVAGIVEVVVDGGIYYGSQPDF